MSRPLEYAGGNFPPRQREPQRLFPVGLLFIGTAVNYLSMLAVIGWSGTAIDHFCALEGGNVLWDSPKHAYYEHWGTDVPGEIGAALILAIITVFTVLLIRRRAHPGAVVAFVLGNLLAIVVMAFMLDDAAMAHGLNP